MKCRQCGKKGVTLAHWRTAHKDWLARRSAAARRKKASGPSSKAPRRRGSRRDSARTEIQAAVEPFTDFFCPGCGTPLRHNPCGRRG